jgi:hypothetical protein
MTAAQTGPARLGRILLAGLAAGLIMNVGEAVLHGSILAGATQAAYAALNRSDPGNPMNLVSLIALTFAQAGVMVWLYTVIRPRMGSRIRASLWVGLAAWLLSSVYAAVYLNSGLPGILPAQLVWVPVAWQLVEYPLAVLVGASVSGK